MTNGIAKKPAYNTLRVAEKATSVGLNSHTLSKRAGISDVTAAKLWRGEQVTGTTMLKIADALDIDLADITIPLGESVQTADGPELQTREARP